MRTEAEIRAKLAEAKQILREIRRDYPDERRVVARWDATIDTLNWMLVEGKYKMMETKRRQKEERDAVRTTRGL
jgi:hypothetical protein